jgi:fibronectin-binding autotransporter adhesin
MNARESLRSVLTAVLLTVGCAGICSAAPVTWDGDTNGNWATGTNWVGDVGPVAGDSLIFTGAINPATINDTAALTGYAGITFNQGGFTLAGNAITLTGNASSTGNNAISLNMALGGADRTFTIASDTLTASGILSAGSVTKAGAGTLNLNGVNTYAGGTTLGTGTLGVGDNAALGGGQLSVTGNATLAALAADRALANAISLAGGTTLALDTSAANLTLDGIISGAGSLSKTVAGTSLLNGGNTYSGGTTLSAGKIGIGNNSALGTGGLTVTGGTLFASGADRSVANDIALDGDVTIENGGAPGRQLTLGGGVTLSGNRQINTVGNTRLNIGGVIGDAGGGRSLTFFSDDGTGMLHLLAANTYTGGTVLSSGTLGIGDNAALGTGQLGVTGNSTLAVLTADRTLTNALSLGGGTTLTVDTSAANMTINSVIGGAGALGKAGGNTLTLNSANTYAGGTVLGGGILGISDDAALGGGQLSVTGNATLAALTADRTLANTLNLGGGTTLALDTSAANLTLGGVISGAGGLAKNTAGTLTLSAANTLTGDTTLGAGTLILGGQVNGNVIVNGGTLMGTGTVGGGGNVTLNGGTFAPGNSIGTTVITGDYVQNAGSTLEIELQKTVGSVLSNDLLAVTGSATLNVGSTINVTDLDAGGVIATGDAFTIITTGTGVTDNGTSISDTSAFLNFSGNILGNNYQLIAARVATFTNNAVGANNRAVAAALDNDANFVVGDGVTLMNTLLGLNAAQFNSAAKQLGPEMYGSTTEAAFWTTRQLTSQMAGHMAARRMGGAEIVTQGPAADRPLLLADASNDPLMLAYMIAQQEEVIQDEDAKSQPSAQNQWTLFAKPFGTFHKQDGSRDRTGFNANAAGVYVGADRWFSPNVLAGLGFGYAHTWLDFHGGRGSGDIETFRVGPYVSCRRDSFFADAAISYGFHMNDVDRNVAFGALNRTAHGEYNAHDVTARLGAGYNFYAGDFVIAPTASLEYIHYWHEGFSESGAGAMNLKVDAETSRSLRSRVGVNLSRVFEVDNTKIVPEVFAGWAHEFIGDEGLDARFSSGVTRFGIENDRPARDSAYFGAAVSVLLNERTSLFVRYEGELASDSHTNSVTVGLAIDF